MLLASRIDSSCRYLHTLRTLAMQPRQFRVRLGPTASFHPEWQIKYMLPLWKPASLARPSPLFKTKLLLSRFPDGHRTDIES